jgi:hypothetical protein
MRTPIVPTFKMVIGSTILIGTIFRIHVDKHPKEVWWQVGGGITPSNKIP